MKTYFFAIIALIIFSFTLFNCGGDDGGNCPDESFLPVGGYENFSGTTCIWTETGTDIGDLMCGGNYKGVPGERTTTLRIMVNGFPEYELLPVISEEEEEGSISEENYTKDVKWSVVFGGISLPKSAQKYQLYSKVEPDANECFEAPVDEYDFLLLSSGVIVSNIWAEFSIDGCAVIGGEMYIESESKVTYFDKDSYIIVEGSCNITPISTVEGCNITSAAVDETTTAWILTC